MFRRTVASLIATALGAAALIGVAAPAQATGEAFSSMSPGGGVPNELVTLTVNVTLDTKNLFNGNPTQGGYYIVLPDFDYSGLTCGANVTFSPAIDAGFTDGKAGYCNRFVAGRGLNFASSYISSMATREYTITITGLRAPGAVGTYSVGLANYDASVVFASQSFIVSAPQAPLDTLDFDGNGGTCTPNKLEGYRTTWAKALTAENCTHPNGWALLGFSTSSTNASGSVFVQPGGWVYFGGSNRLYAIWAKPAVPADAPTDVVAVAGRNKVTVSWKVPVNDGGGQITNYIAQANPSGRICITSRGDANMLSCAINLPATNTKYTFTAQALNNAGWGNTSAASNAVSPFDLVLGEASRERQGVVFGVWLGGSTISFVGRAPGVDPGTTVTPQLKVGASGSWVSETRDLPKVNASGAVSWSKKLARSTNKQPVEVRFAIGAETSNSYTVKVGQSAGVPTAPRNVKVTTTVDGKLRVAWTPPASDGGSAITRYVMTSDLPGMESCPVSADKTVCTRTVRNNRVDPNRTYQFSVVATNATGQSKPGTASWRGQVSNLYITFLRSNPNWSGNGEQVTLRVSADGYTPGTKLTVEMRIGEDGAWKRQKGDLVLDFEYNDREWVGIVDAVLKGKPVYFRVKGPQGTTEPKLLTWAGGARG